MKIFRKKNHMVGWTKGWHNFRFLVPFANKGLDVSGKRACTSHFLWKGNTEPRDVQWWGNTSWLQHQWVLRPNCGLRCKMHWHWVQTPWLSKKYLFPWQSTKASNVATSEYCGQGDSSTDFEQSVEQDGMWIALRKSGVRPIRPHMGQPNWEFKSLSALALLYPAADWDFFGEGSCVLAIMSTFTKCEHGKKFDSLMGWAWTSVYQAGLKFQKYLDAFKLCYHDDGFS